MYEMDGIAYPGHPEWVKQVIYAEYMGNRIIRAALNTGEVVDVDFSQGDYAQLQNEDVLRNFTVAHGILSWLDDTIEVVPEVLLNAGKMIEGPVEEF